MSDPRIACQEKCTRRTLDINSPKLLGRGNPNADIMFIGDAPKTDEDMEGEPFVDLAGSALRELLSEYVNISDVYITHAVKCAHTDDTKKPSKKEIGCCREYLLEEIKSVNPNVICCLGATALEAVLKRTGISKIHNNLFYSDELKKKVIPIYHPAYILRNPALEEDLLKGIALVIKESVTPDYHKAADIKIQHMDADTPEKIEKVLRKLEKVNKFVFDLETSSLDHRDAKILCFSFSWGAGIGVTIPYSMVTPKVKKRLIRIFRSRKKLKIAHNIKFDLKILKAHGFRPRGPYYCTLAGIALVDENLKEKSLDALTLRHTNIGEYWAPLDKFKKEYCKINKIKVAEFSYAYIPYDILKKYAQYDADVTYRIYVIVDNELNRQDLIEFFNNYTMPILRVLLETEYIGIRVDRKKLKKLLKVYEKRIEKALEVIMQNTYIGQLEEIRKIEKSVELAVKWENGKTLKTTYETPEAYAAVRIKPKDYEFNPRSVQQLRRVLFEVMDITPRSDERTPTGAPSTDSSVLTRLAEEDNVELCKEIMEYRQLVKFTSTYITSAIEKSELNGRIHPMYKQHYAVTGRLSSANPNFQNIPRDAKDYKSCLLADPGYIIIKADLAQAEFRCWAHYSNDTDMIRDIEAGLDIHRRTAAEIFNKAEEDVTPEERTFAKNCVFGYMYGRGAKAVAAQYGISVEYAQEVKKNFFARYPRAAMWLKKQVAHARAHGYVTTWMGRIRRLPEIHSQDNMVVAEAERQAKNSPIQGLASDMNNHYGVTNMRLAKKHVLDVKPMATVHDANFIQVKVAQLSEMVSIMDRVVKKAFPDFRCEMKLDVEVGFDLGNMQGIDEYMEAA